MQNLWPEFDNEKLLAESAGRAQKQTASQRRRPTEQAVLSTLREWLLHEYIVPYCRSLAATRIFRRCYWIDGLGGNHILQPALSTSQELAKENKPISLHYIALESKSSKRKEANTARNITLPKESGIILQIQRHFPLKTSPHSTSVPCQQNSACSFHISRSRAVYSHFCIHPTELQRSPPFFVMIVGSHRSRIALT